MQFFLKLLFIVVFLLIVGWVFLYIPEDMRSLEYAQKQYQPLKDYYITYPNLSAFIYLMAYILATSLSLPFATILSLIGGAIFGFIFGGILAIVGASIGATIAFLSARFILRQHLERHFSKQLQQVNEGINKQGHLYLFSLRLLPLIPFFVVNLLFGLTQMRVHHFFMISVIGMLPASLVYVNAGTQLGQLQSVGDIMSLSLFLSLMLLAALPWLTQKLLNLWLKTP